VGRATATASLKIIVSKYELLSIHWLNFLYTLRKHFTSFEEKEHT
jgi:hypothetical protein